jgi:hypothetical protein
LFREEANWIEVEMSFCVGGQRRKVTRKEIKEKER